MRRLTLVFTILAMLALSIPALADEGERDGGDRDGDHGDNGDHDGQGRDHGRNVFGPFASSSPDSGTCGNDWANDTFKRVFTVKRNADGTFTLREDFRDGEFVTVAGASPGACETSTPHGTTIRAGVRGEFGGFLAGPVTGGTFTAAGGCPAPCNGDKFVAIHFGTAAVWTVTTFDFRFEADDEDGLSFTHWRNASPDRGGNRGDIAD
jgi:hypothetical protein